MADSAVKAIYASIAAMEVAGASSRDITAIKLAIKSADMPMRMLLPSTKGVMSYVGLGTLNNMSWVIRDLCLWAPLSAGTGVQQFAEDMIDYIVAYIKALKALRNPTAQSVITGVAFQMGPIPWGDNDYWGVDITLTVEEII